MTPPRVTVLVHGGPNSIEAVRARGLASRHPEGSLDLRFREGSRTDTARAWRAAVAAGSPDLIYVLNTAAPGAVLAPWWNLASGARYVLDTGDAVYEMARESGVGAGWKLPLLRVLERLAHRRAAAVVVRGSRHRELLLSRGLRRVEVIRDGYSDRQDVPPGAVAGLRRRLGLEGRFVVGLMGSTVWSPKLGICYGWDLLGALADLGDLPVSGLVIGDGDGLPWLRERACALGVEGRVAFAGRIPYAEVPLGLRALDIALSTQTNNLPGRVRTTGKLPEYMAAGRFILASRVGDAEVLLPEPMLVDYAGTVDTGYPARLAGRVREVHARPDLRALAAALPARARELCSYEVLSAKWSALIESLTTNG